MAKSEIECKKMVVYLDLLSRDLSLIPQAEKIETIKIDDIEKHIKSSTLNFSAIQKEFKRKNRALRAKTHKKLKKQFLECFTSSDKFDKSIIRFALYKMNNDEDVKKNILDNINQLELFYDAIIFYMDEHFPDDSTFNLSVMDYLLGETPLFQYNKALILKDYKHLDFNEDIFRANFKTEKAFWIVQYQLISWLCRCKKEKLAETSYIGDNYYIRRRLNKLKAENLSDDTDAQKVFVESLIDNENPLISMQGLNL